MNARENRNGVLERVASVERKPGTPRRPWRCGVTKTRRTFNRHHRPAKAVPQPGQPPLSSSLARKPATWRVMTISPQA